MSHIDNEILQQDKNIYYLLLAQAPILLISGMVGSSLLTLSIISAIGIALLTQAAYSLFKGTTLFGIAAAVLMMSTSALLIQTQMGMIEMHFHIFASMVVFLLYQRWQPIIAALLTVAIHHISFTYIQMQGVVIADIPITIFANDCTWTITFIHAVFAAVESVVLIFMSIQMKLDSSANRNIAGAIQKLSEENDLTVSLHDPKSPAEHAFNDMLATLSSIFSEYQQISSQLSETSHTLNNIGKQTQQNTEQQRERSQNVSQSTLHILESVSNIAINSSDSSEKATQVEQDSLSDSTQVMTVMEDMSALETEITSVSLSLNELTEDVNSVTSLLQAIRSISEQTNLLALNAAIEAARAGESGRGFAVVADEVRALAQRTSQATDDIQTVLDRLNTSVEKTVHSMGSGKEQTTQNVSQVKKIVHRMTERADDIHQVSRLSKTIAQTTQEQENLLQEIGQQIQQNVESTHDLNEHMQKMVNEANEVSSIAEQYRIKATIFKIS
ncbi:methyl-accepting chemotaxis protein [Aestuariirhabdus sp. Z084]|uniref:methyl-accepting chemotaxis protein n=1 Tax=Aestuariirhabdus haliotis TaxID=2918751 RepID=UPI00201B3D34|nr:methyl-accepting chemotaxis protein [Aestuariirhabdus haliotis]MCL6416929.1 methyl-accepting chemotaxis protein [Aestuariirhabdus haliotis]MCL6420909.1 methyl-accepting chemotaxis protein [Aestuariirhabdus haliotis]